MSLITKIFSQSPKISVIVPIYNVEKYLKDCLDSVCNQTFEDIEIICINDGSTDDSSNILNSYVKKDNRIKVINQSNKGLSAARNAGLNIAKGKYIYFCDSDDFMDLNSLNELYDLMENNSYDLIIFKAQSFADETHELTKIKYHEMPELTKLFGNKTFNPSDLYDKFLKLDATVYTKFFKRKLIGNIHFKEGLIFEDNLFLIEYLFNCHEIYFYDKYLYHRCFRQTSILNSNFEKHMDSLEVFKIIEDMIKENGYYYELKEIVFNTKYEMLEYRINLFNKEYSRIYFDRIKLDLLDKKEEYEKCLDLSKIDPKSKLIYENFLKSDSYEEFKENMKK